MPEANMHLGLSQPLRTLVAERFAQAQASQSLIFSDTQLAVLRSKAGIPFQLRYCPALSKKPTDNKQSSSPSQLPNQGSAPPRRKFDPFENPVPDLLVARVPDPAHPTHNLVLNKYPVIPNHFILATLENKPQTGLLEEADIALTYACLQAWHNDQNKLYAFFNSGRHSGASQPHRHLQFLSVQDMRGSILAKEWDLICDRMTTPIQPHLPLQHDPALPIIHLATPLAVTMTASQLHEKYLLLLRASVVLLESPVKSSAHAADRLISQNLASARIATDDHSTTISYNLAMTTDRMAIIPRRAEDATILGLAGNTDSGEVSINGTILAGTLMVKEEDEWEALKANPEHLDDMLKQIGHFRGELSRI